MRALVSTAKRLISATATTMAALSCSDHLMNGLMSMVIEHSSRGERAYDIFCRLLEERIVCVNGPINDYTAHVVTPNSSKSNPKTPRKPSI